MIAVYIIVATLAVIVAYGACTVVDRKIMKQVCSCGHCQQEDADHDPESVAAGRCD